MGPCPEPQWFTNVKGAVTNMTLKECELAPIDVK